VHGWALVELKGARQGLDEFVKGLSIYRATGASFGVNWRLVTLGEVYAKLSSPTEALNCVSEAQDITDTTDEHFYDSKLHQMRGDLLLAAGDQAGADQAYHRALAVAKQQNAKLFEIDAAVRLARLWRDQGKRTEAHDLLAPIYSWFTEGLDTPVLKEAKALLDKLSSR